LITTDQLKSLIYEHFLQCDAQLKSHFLLLNVWLECESLDLKLWGEFLGVFHEPSVERDAFNFIIPAENDVQICFGVDWTVVDADGDENLVGLVLNESHDHLYVFHELGKQAHWHGHVEDLGWTRRLVLNVTFFPENLQNVVAHNLQFAECNR